MASALFAEALAVAAQSLMTRDLGEGSVAGARQVASRVGELSLGLGLLLAVALAAGGGLLPRLFSADPQVLRLMGGERRTNRKRWTSIS
jgi:Na+-driven multidrug efflux pump